MLPKDLVMKLVRLRVVASNQQKNSENEQTFEERTWRAFVGKKEVGIGP
jgi:hypothetical protein